MRRERGMTTVEFAIVGTVLLTVLFGVIEFGRLLWTYAMVGEAARRAARLAVVCPINDPQIAAAATFAGTDVAPPHLGAQNVEVQYLDDAGAVIDDPAGRFVEIRQVRVTVSGVAFDLAIPFVAQTLTVRDFVVTLPRESLGAHAPGVSGAC